ncbi:ribosomal protein S15 [Batrachochytrium salamandrivorans]|nr:ribosomal protein S15 [Batrachochytrium salamandrivorans]
MRLAIRGLALSQTRAVSSFPPLTHFRSPGDRRLEHGDLMSRPVPSQESILIAEKILTSSDFFNQSQLLKMHKHKAIDEFKRHAADTGSSEVQVAALSLRIKFLQEHFAMHKKDVHSRRGLMAIMQRRRKLLLYMAREDPLAYQTVIERYDIREGQGSSRVTDRKETWSQPRKHHVLSFRPKTWVDFKKPPPYYVVKGHYAKKVADLEQEKKEEKFRKEGKKVTKRF